MQDTEYKALVKQIETEDLTDAAREKAKQEVGGSFLDLPCGNTHYLVEGPEDGTPAVLVHGYATPYFLYDKVAETLVSKGYRVLRYDLLGRGLSERVKGDYGPEQFAEQLKEVSEAVFEEQSFVLFGTSMGGSITTTFGALYPEKVQKLVLLAPAGMDSFQPPFYMKLANISGMGELIFAVAGVKLSMNGCAAELIHADEEGHDEYTRQFAYSTRFKGLGRCLLASLRHTILNTKRTTENYKVFADHHIPTLVLWGTADKTMPYYQIDRMKEVLPEATFQTLEGSGHIFLYDEGDRTMEYVVPFLTD